MNPDPLLEEAASGDLASPGAYLDRCQEKNCLLEGTLALLAVRQQQVEKRVMDAQVAMPAILPPPQAPFPQIAPVRWISPLQTEPLLTPAPNPLQPRPEWRRLDQPPFLTSRTDGNE